MITTKQLAAQQPGGLRRRRMVQNCDTADFSIVRGFLLEPKKAEEDLRHQMGEHLIQPHCQWLI